MSLRSAIAILLFTAVCAVAQVPATPAANPASRAKTGSITGSIVNENGQPLPNVNILLRTFSSLRPVQSASTDSDGKFEINGLEPSTYQISASLSAYTQLPRDDATANNYHIGDSVRLVMVRGGVITGTVTTQTGEPVVGVRVRAATVNGGESPHERPTDDRGIYRIYGLPSGKYVVWAGGAGSPNSAADPYDNDVPTYSPSSTRDSAAEVSVRIGEETTNVDIRYRGEPGRTVSGTVSNPLNSPSGIVINLTSAADGGSQLNLSTFQSADSRGFIFSGLDDGEYTLTARTFLPNGEWGISAPKRVSVSGADVSGIELSVKPLASVSGQVVLEELKTKECVTKQPPILSETLVSAWHRQDDAANLIPKFVWGLGTPASADPEGSVTLRNLVSGDYYFVTRFLAKTWYLQSITISSSTTKKTVDATRVWTTVKSGDRLSGLKITLAEGAASLSGHVALAEGDAPPENLFVYLVPAEKEKADEVLRFYAASVNKEAKITLTNIAPGRYWLLARSALEGGLTKLRLPDEIEPRMKLRRETEAAKTEIELKPCQNVVDYRLKLGRSEL